MHIDDGTAEVHAAWASAAAMLRIADETECALRQSDFCEVGRGLIVFLRHGESEWNGAEPGSARFTGWHDVPLSLKGVQQARDAAKILDDHGCVLRLP